MPRFYFYRDKGKIIKIDLHDVLYLQSTGNYTSFEGRTITHIVRTSLEKALDNLPGDTFVRVSRSHALSVHNVQAFDKESAWFKAGDPELDYNPSKKHFEISLAKLNLLDKDAAEQKETGEGKTLE